MMMVCRRLTCCSTVTSCKYLVISMRCEVANHCRQLTFHDAIGFSPALFAQGKFGCVVSARLTTRRHVN